MNLMISAATTSLNRCAMASSSARDWSSRSYSVSSCREVTALSSAFFNASAAAAVSDAARRARALRRRSESMTLILARHQPDDLRLNGGRRLGAGFLVAGYVVMSRVLD